MRRTLALAATSTLAIVTLLAACGSDAVTSGNTLGTVPGSDSTSGTTDDPAISGDPDSDYCQLVRKYDEQASVFDDVLTGGSNDPAEMQAAFEELQAIIDELVAAAPAEVAADAKVMGDSTHKMVDLLASYDYDFNALLASADANTLNALFSSTEVAAASDHLDQYDQQVCGIDVGS